MFIQTKCNELSFADLIRATKDTIDESKKFPYKTFPSDKIDSKDFGYG